MTPVNHSQSPIPRQPIGATFAVAVSVLGFFLALQFLAVAWHFLPKLRQQMVESATLESVQPATEAASAPATAAAVAENRPTGDTSQAPAPPDAALIQRINRLVDESDRAYRIGEFEAALTGIDEADSLLPNDAGILMRKARVLESMDRTPDAAELYARVAALPGLAPEFRARATRKIEQLGGMTGGTSAVRRPGTDAAIDTSADVRDEIGLQPGANLGIVDARIRDGNPGTKVLRIAIKSRPNVQVDTRQMKLHVFFYEKNETGDIQLTESKVNSQWISPPVNWADNEPELLDVTYLIPEAGADGLGIREYAGYVVGVYYNDELQDTRAEPGPLAKQFPLPLYLKQSAE